MPNKTGDKLIADFLVVLDFDRTLSNESKIDRAMYKACASVGIDTDRLQKTKAKVEAGGESFSILEHLYATQPASVVKRIKAAFVESIKRQSALYKDTMEFLEALRQAKSVNDVILTQGNREWQELKIIASQLHERLYHITDEKDKGKLISSWRTADNAYRLPFSQGLAARRIILIDDKAKSFASLPEDCLGFLVRRPDEAVLPSQSGSTPPNVSIVSSLLDVLEQLPLSKYLGKE